MQKNTRNSNPTPPSANSKTMSRNTSDLPPEIIEIILSRLPAKCLLRFKTVSKSWSIMISDPAFIQNHTQRSKCSNSDNLFLCNNGRISCSSTCPLPVVKLEDRKIQYLQEIECPYGNWQGLCYCDGVVLLYYGTLTFALWNPSTRASAELSPPDFHSSTFFGLCHDPTTDDFKVVIVYWPYEYYYSVYSCKNNSWMRKRLQINHNTGLVVSCVYNPGVCVDGACYWVCIFDNAREIFYYDPRDDELKMLQKPENIVDGGKQIYVIELRGCLCLYCNGRDEKTVQIWTKENGIDNHSWKELMTVENVDMSIWEFEPLCFVGNKIVIRNSGFGRLLVYNPCEKRFEEFEEDTRVFDPAGVPIPYIDSMFFPVEKPRPNN